MVQNFDLGIIGGGPAGYTAALHAAAKGLRVVMFEKDCVGGGCLNRGCIPTKAILHSAELFEEMKCAQELGINCESLSVDYKSVIEHKNKVVERLRKALELSLKNSGVTSVKAEACLNSSTEIEADGEIFKCKNIIAACGSSPRSLKGMEFDGEFILNSDDILNRDRLPESIVIVGSGAIGTEWARIFAAFGVQVTIVEMAENLLPAADIEVSKRVERIFKTKKIKAYKSTSVEKIQDKKVYLTTGEILEPECVLIAAGRVPNSCKKFEGVAYLGDMYGSVQLAHFAIKQAVSYVDGISFEETLVPSVVYGSPEIAWVGKREQDLEEGTYQKSLLLISALGKSHCDNSTDGFIKILSQYDRIVGAHIVSKEASAMIQQVLIAIQNNISVSRLKEICFAHPTYSEGIFESLFKL